MASKMARKSAFSLAKVKTLMNQSFETSLETQLEAERQGLADCGNSPEGREGLAAFVEKRKPDMMGAK